MRIFKKFLCKPLIPTSPTLYNYTRTRFCALLIEDGYEFLLSIYVTNVIPRQELLGVGEGGRNIGIPLLAYRGGNNFGYCLCTGPMVNCEGVGAGKETCLLEFTGTLH